MAFKNTYYIVAANNIEYNDWLKSDRPNQIIPEKTNGEYYEIRYVSSVDILRGLSEIKGFYIKGCERHPEYNEIKSVIEIIKMTHNRPVNNHYQSKNAGIIAQSILDDISTNNNNVIIGKTITGVWLDEYEDSTGGTVDQGVPTP